jgi:hypothetical protein
MSRLVAVRRDEYHLELVLPEAARGAGGADDGLAMRRRAGGGKLAVAVMG